MAGSRVRIPRRIINEPYVVCKCVAVNMLYNNILFRLRFQNDDVRIKYVIYYIYWNNLMLAELLPFLLVQA